MIYVHVRIFIGLSDRPPCTTWPSNPVCCSLVFEQEAREDGCSCDLDAYTRTNSREEMFQDRRMAA
jgi:hypothetical protein